MSKTSDFRPGMLSMQPLLILGTGIYAPELLDLLEASDEFRVTGFVENLRRDHPDELAGLPVHWIDELPAFAASHMGLCSLATAARDAYVAHAQSLGLRFAKFIHPTASVSRTSTLGAGTIVATRAVIASHTQIGQHVRINRGALIGHHARIDDFVTIQPGANLGGCSQIGPGATIAMGAVVLDRVTVGADAFVGAGAVVTKNVPAGVQVLGVPARIVKQVEPQRRAA